MKAIVTAIEPPWVDEIASAWGEIKAVFGLKGLTGAVRPYLTFHVAEDYDPAVELTLGQISARGAPFTIETHGIGITEGERVVIYLHVTRTEALDDVHQVLHHAVRPHAIQPRAVYDAETWMPHIAIAAGRIERQTLPEVVAFLARRDFIWSIRATNLCLIPDTSLAGAEWLRFDLRGGH